MDDAKKILHEIQQFIDDYMYWSQKRGEKGMYGSLEVLESNWCLLDHIYFILHEIEKESRCGFRAFLLSKGFGAKSAATFIKENDYPEPYTELNKLWNEYLKWRKPKIDEILKARNASMNDK